MELIRGAIVVAGGPGDYARKPRPFLVVQSDLFNPYHNSVSLCPLTSVLTGNTLFRIALPPSETTGLVEPSEVQIDKVQSLRRDRIERVIGAAPDSAMILVDRALRRWFDLS